MVSEARAWKPINTPDLVRRAERVARRRERADVAAVVSAASGEAECHWQRARASPPEARFTHYPLPHKLLLLLQGRLLPLRIAREGVGVVERLEPGQRPVLVDRSQALLHLGAGFLTRLAAGELEHARGHGDGAYRVAKVVGHDREDVVPNVRG